MDKTYLVYDLMQPKDKQVVATIIGKEVTGQDAEYVKKELLARGWPDITPDIIFHGSYYFAIEKN